MHDWTSGYVTDIDYVYCYCPELDPSRLELPFLDAGLAFPEVATACELGFGQGLSVNLHAAASGVRWYGTDFNPAQADFARELARASGASAALYDQAFADFCARADLPDFDYIGLHGVWSWVSDDNRSVIVDFIRRKLRVGGVVYISYNTYPGWAPMMPLRDLLTEHRDTFGVPGAGIVSGIDGALAFAKRLFATNPVYTRRNPDVVERLRRIEGDDRSYLAHEYFNRDWQPMPFSRMAARLADAKLEYACSAHVLGRIDAVNLSAEQQAFLEELPDPRFRESVRDFMVSQQFRRDYWVKGARRLAPLERDEMLRAKRVILTRARAEVSLEISGALGRATLDGPAYDVVLDALSDHRSRTIGEVEQIACARGVSFPEVVEAVLVLSGKNALSSAQDEAVVREAKPRADQVNRHLLRKSRSSDVFQWLASPVTGAGVPVGRVAQLFMMARMQGKASRAAWIDDAWAHLQMQGQSLIKDGKPLDGAEANLAELASLAERFEEQQVKVLESLQILA